MMKLFYPGQRGGPFGWGVFGEAMTKALAAHFDVVAEPTGADVAFLPCADHDLNLVAAPTAPINIGMTFFESALGERAAANAAKLDLLFVGSSWCLDRAWERGITNTKVLMQGVDQSIFWPHPRAKDGQFRIFSGGKFEWRKGQDLVIRAFAQFAKTHPDAHLVCSWFNPWPGLVRDMVQRMLGIPAGERDSHEGQRLLYEQTLLYFGIPRDRFTILPQLGQHDLANAMRGTDIGLFPNRCEGGTNLVLMEYLSCGRRAVTNTLTGHADLWNEDDYIVRIMAMPDAQHWAEQSVQDIVDALEVAYAERNQPFQSPPAWTWEAAAKTVADEVARIAGKE